MQNFKHADSPKKPGIEIETKPHTNLVELKEEIRHGHCGTKELEIACQRGEITKQERDSLGFLLAKKLEMIAPIDPLTGVFNRAFLEPKFNDLVRELNHSAEKRKSIVDSVMLILLDINHFKELNDKYGHALGDQVLIEVAKRLKSAIKMNDTVFRVGGDEFILLLSIADENPRLLEAIFKRIQAKVNIDFSIRATDNTNVQITLAMGYGVLEKGKDETVDQLMQKADEKMYANKRGQRSRNL